MGEKKKGKELNVCSYKTHLKVNKKKEMDPERKGFLNRLSEFLDVPRTIEALEKKSYKDSTIMDFTFQKLYDQLGEEDELIRTTFHVAFDFSEKENYCAAMKNGTYMFCGEPCGKDMFCGLHKARMYKYKMISGPCLGCGIGVDDYRHLCRVCKEKRRQTTQSEKPSPVPKPEEKIKNRRSSRPKFSMIDDEFCFGLRD